MRRLLWSLALLALFPACSGDATPAASAAITSAPPAATPEPSESAGSTSRSPIDGVYRVTVTRQDGVAAGLSNRQAGEIDGVVTTTFSLGQVTQFINGGILSDGFMGSFVVEGDHEVLTSFDDQQLTLGYRLKAKELTFTLDESGSGLDAAFAAALWTSHPWERR